MVSKFAWTCPGGHRWSSRRCCSAVSRPTVYKSASAYSMVSIRPAQPALRATRPSGRPLRGVP